MMLKIILFVSFVFLGLNAEEEDCDFDRSLGRFLPNLVIQARRSEECLNKSREIFKSGFPLIELRGPFDDEGNSTILKLRTIADINDAFEFFGDLARFIVVDFSNISIPHGKEIIRRVNNCSSLTSIDFENCHGKILAELDSPLPKVRSLKFSIHPTKEFAIKPGTKKLHEILPAISYLGIGNMTSADGWTFIREVSKTVSVLNLNDELDEANEANLIDFLENNPNVLVIDIEFGSRRLLNKLIDVLDKRMSLSVNGLSQNYSNDGEVHFGALFSFKFSSKSENDILDGVHLDKIQKLYLEIPNVSVEWMDFLKNQVNPDLNELELKTENVSKEQLFEIVESIPNLKHIELTAHIDDINDIVDILESDNKLKRFSLISDLSEEQAKELGEKLEGEWIVTFEQNDWRLGEGMSITNIKRVQ